MTPKPTEDYYAGCNPALLRAVPAGARTILDVGCVLTIPDRYVASNPAVPSARDVAPWVAIVGRLWDDPEFEARHQALARAEVRRWDADQLVERYQDFFRSVARTR